ncbi:MAG: ATP-binding protein [Bacteroidota bacterium]
MEEKCKQKPSDIIKIVLFGPESTGKTTLAQQLGHHYNTVWVPEYARTYLQDKWDREHKICETRDLMPIARGQMKSENELTEKANKILFCDTDLLETKVYSETYFGGYCPPQLEKCVLQNTYDLYFLAQIDVPWIADDLRDKPNERALMFSHFRAALEKYNRNFVVLKGNQKLRLATAIQHIDNLLNP